MTEHLEKIQELPEEEAPKAEEMNTNKDSYTHKNEKTPVIPPETKTYAHLKTYPIAASWIRIAHWFPSPRVIRPILYKQAYTGSMRNYTVTVDDFIDSQILGTLDKRVPTVKTLRMRDIRDFLTDPFVRAYRLADRVLIHPARSTIQDARINVRNGISDISSAGEPGFMSRIDPYLKPVNEEMVNLINQRYPDNPVEGSSTDYPNEFRYTIELVNDGVSRSRNSAESQLQLLRSIPSSASKKVAEIYHENLSKRGESDSRTVMMIASLDTIRTLINSRFKVILPSTTETNPDAVSDNTVPPEL